MTPEERQAKIEKLPTVKFAIVGLLYDGKLDAAICTDDLHFEKELEKFEVYRCFKLVEIHKR